MASAKRTEEPVAEWYIIHAYAGHEMRVKQNLDQRVTTMDMKHKIFDVVVPTEEEVEIKGGQRKPRSRQIFPGYILIKMVMDEESWHVVRDTPGVTGFVTTEDETERRPKPVPLDQREVDNIFNQIKSEEPRVRVGFAKGETVRITDGPFVDFMGGVDDVFPERSKVRVLVSFFGRETPVELDFLQIERV